MWLIPLIKRSVLSEKINKQCQGHFDVEIKNDLKCHTDLASLLPGRAFAHAANMSKQIMKYGKENGEKLMSSMLHM